MLRDHQLRRPNRRQFYTCVEGLEDRQLLSASGLSAGLHAAGSLPNAQPAGLTILGAQPDSTPASAGPYSPAQIRTAYGVTSLPNGGQGTTVAIVDAYNDPDITNDLAIFSSEFALPQMNGVGGNPTFSISTPPGQPTPANAPADSWAVEISLDVEWVHSIAPYANIDLIETTNNGGDYLYAAEVDGQPYESGVAYAASLPGVDVVSNSYGSSEFNGETAYDSEFTTPAGHIPVAFTFSTGDDGAPGEYPAFSPNVVAVGGTDLYTTSARGVYGSEIGWSGGGGGVSQYESTPAYQSSNGVNYGARSTPDVSMDAAPNTGVWVIDQYDFPGEFVEVGGTSASTPMWAGIIDLGDQSRIAGGGTSLSTSGVLNSLYGAYNSSNYLNDFHDITSGNNGFAAGPGYDLVTGIGTPKAQDIVPLLASAGSAPVASTVTSPSRPSTGGSTGAVVVTKTEPTPVSLTTNAVSSGLTTEAVSGESVLGAANGSESVSNSTEGQPALIETSSVAPDRINSLLGGLDGTGDATAGASTLSRLEVSIGSDTGASGTVTTVAAPVADALETIAPASFAESISDAVFADPTTGSLVDNIDIDNMAAASMVPLAADGSHLTEMGMLAAGVALMLNPPRSALERLKRGRKISGRGRRVPQ